MLYPMLLDSLLLDCQGVLQLGGGSGKLQHKDQTWPLVLGQPDNTWRNIFTPRQHGAYPVDRICNLFGSEKVHWAVTEGDKSSRDALWDHNLTKKPSIRTPS